MARARTNLRRLATATAVGSIGLAAGGTAGGLLAVEITGNTGTAGLPLGVLVAGSAAGAVAISRGTHRLGRGRSLAAGYAVGAVGATIVVVASSRGFVWLLIGSLLMGPANAAVFLTRYATAETADPPRRVRALGSVLAAAAVGSVLGPFLLAPSGRLATSWGLHAAGGLYLVAVPAFLLAALPLASLPAQGAAGRPMRRSTRRRGLLTRPVVASLVVLAASNLVMVSVMAVAAIHMLDRGHTLQFVGASVNIHVLGCSPLPRSPVGWQTAWDRRRSWCSVPCSSWRSGSSGP